MTAHEPEHYQIEGLRRYADFDRSDPFTYARGLAHIRQGLCGACTAIDMPWAGGDKRAKISLGKLGGEVGNAGHYNARPIAVGVWGNVSRL